MLQDSPSKSVTTETSEIRNEAVTEDGFSCEKSSKCCEMFMNEVYKRSIFVLAGFRYL